MAASVNWSPPVRANSEMSNLDSVASASCPAGPNVTPPGRDRLLRVVDQVEHDLHDRGAAGVAGPAQRRHDPGERQVLVLVRAHHGLAHPAQELGERRVSRGITADGQRVDQEADQRGERRAPPVGAGRADHQVVLPGVAVQHRVQPGHQRREQGRALAAAQLPQVVQQAGRQRAALLPAVEVVHRRPRPVSGQPQRRRAVQRPPPPRRQLLARRPGQPLPLPHRVVGELHRQLVQAGRLARHLGPVQLGQVAHQHPGRPAVEHAVVHRDEQDVLLVGQPDQVRPQQWSPR